MGDFLPADEGDGEGEEEDDFGCDAEHHEVAVGVSLGEVGLLDGSPDGLEREQQESQLQHEQLQGVVHHRLVVHLAHREEAEAQLS